MFVGKSLMPALVALFSISLHTIFDMLITHSRLDMIGSQNLENGLASADRDLRNLKLLCLNRLGDMKGDDK